MIAGGASYPGRMTRSTVAVLSIAGSDSGGGAGIQADLKAFARCGVHGMTAITALTAQNTVGVTAVHAVPGDFIVEQVRAIVEDIAVAAVKIGMLGTAETVAAVDSALDLLEPGTPVVIDPVMVAEFADDAADGGGEIRQGRLFERRGGSAILLGVNHPVEVLTGGRGDERHENEARERRPGRARHRAAPHEDHWDAANLPVPKEVCTKTFSCLHNTAIGRPRYDRPPRVGSAA